MSRDEIHLEEPGCRKHLLPNWATEYGFFPEVMNVDSNEIVDIFYSTQISHFVTLLSGLTLQVLTCPLMQDTTVMLFSLGDEKACPYCACALLIGPEEGGRTLSGSGEGDLFPP